jgi:hypothetical protein
VPYGVSQGLAAMVAMPIGGRFQRLGGAVGTAIFAVILQHGLDAGKGAGAFADTFWWVLGLTVLTVIPALLLPNGPAPAQDAARDPAAAPEPAPA